jgi:serine/threonine protein kinase
MAVRIESQAEPLPGYRLIERLGGGGFGEVWKCEAPGGLHKAIKFVFGDLQATDEDGARAEQELKALSRVKTVHHPYILSLERYDIIDGQLIIVMELADRTLWDRFRECKEKGLPGIPREELLAYMAETAEALDLMNSLYQLQHLDIKPQNIFLVHNHVKVADFGLVKDLEGMMASVTGGVTPVYAAPETFDGWVSRFSDQYSLAIVYMEVLTGQRPFTGTSIRQLVLQHLQATPDLSALSPTDREVIGKALSKKPDDRYGTCGEMVQALQQASQPMPSGPAPKLPELPNEPTPPPSIPQTQPEDGGVKTHGGPRRRPGAARGRREAGLSPGIPAEAPTPAPPSAAPPEPTSAASGEGSPASARDTPEPSATASPLTECSLVPRAAPVDLKGDGVLQPALVIGLGNHGLAILKRLRRELFEHFGTHDALPHVRLLYLDTDPDALQTAIGGNPESALRSAEVLLARLHRPSHYLKPGLDGQQKLVSWLNPKLLYRMPRQQTSAGLRGLGRLAFVDNFRGILRRLHHELEACCSPEILQLAAGRTGLGIHSSTPRVYVATSLAGGTGGGMFLDLAYAVRYLLKRLGYGQAETVGVFLLPDVEKSTAPTPGLANAFAALTELNHFAAPNSVFQARYETMDQSATMSITEVGPPYQRCVLLPLPERRGAGGWTEPPGNGSGPPEPPAAGPLGLAGHFLLAELATPLGLAAQNARGTAPSVPTYQTVGMYRLLWPRRQMVQQAARDLCKRLVQRWMSKDAKPLRESVQRWVEAQWSEQGLTADQLILRLQEDCERTLGQPPETIFAGVLAALTPLTPPSGKAAATAPEQPFKPAVVLEVMEELEKLVGIPEACKPSGPTLSDSLSTMEQAVHQASESVADECDQHLAELLVRLIEEPAFRLAGAEEAIRQFNAAVEKALDHQEHLGKELHVRSVALYQRIQALLGTAGQVTSTSRKTPVSKKAHAQTNALVSELLSLVRSYPKCRYQSLVLQNLAGLYVSLRGLLSEQMREIGFCRQRLSELADLFTPGSTADLVPAAGRCLFASDCDSLRAAVTQLVNGISPADLQALDQRVQRLLQRQWRALVHICTASSSVIRNVAPAMQQETEAFLIEGQAGANVADLFLEQPRDKSAGEDAAGALQQDLVKIFDQAETALAITAGHEVCLLALPSGPGEQAFLDATKEALPDVSFATAASTDEILFYREQVGFALTDLKQLGPAGREAYHQMTRREQYLPHSRADITDWRAAPVTGS